MAGSQDIVYTGTGIPKRDVKNLALTNIGSSPEFTPEQIQDLYQHRNEEEWNFYQILQPALQQTYNLRVSGGSQNTTYMFSGAFSTREATS